MKHPSRSPVQKKNAVTSEPLPLSPRTSRGTRYGSSRRRRTPPSPSQPRPASTPLLRGRHPTTAALSTHPHPLTQLSLRRRHLDLVRSIPAARITLLLCSPRAAVFTHPAGFAAPRWQGLRSPPTPATPAVHLRHLPSPHAQLCLLDEFVLLEDDRFFLKLQGRLPSSSLPPWDAMEMKLPSTRVGIQGHVGERGGPWRRCSAPTLPASYYKMSFIVCACIAAAMCVSKKGSSLQQSHDMDMFFHHNWIFGFTRLIGGGCCCCCFSSSSSSRPSDGGGCVQAMEAMMSTRGRLLLQPR
ncbi:hypothetical protein VPH35_013330 [Triticum aestivum]